VSHPHACRSLAGTPAHPAWFRRALTLVRLVPVEQDSMPRQGGQLRGKIWIAEDFDAPESGIEKLCYGGEP
jgi:hypothetical protein